MRRIAIGLVPVLIAVIVGPPLLARLMGWGPDAGRRPAPGRSVSIGAGLALNVAEVGEGPPVVLVHGLPSCAADWAALPQRLAAHGYRVIAYDRIGYGYSSRADATPDRYTFTSNARDLLALLDALGLERATLVGWSYGGGVVQTLAEQAPNRVANLVLLAAVGPAQPEDGNDPLSLALASPIGAGILRWVAAIPPLGRRLTQENVTRAFARADAVPSGWTEYTQAMLALPGTLDAFVLEAQRSPVALLHPERLSAPTLILQGTADYLVPPAVADDLHRRIAGSQLTTVPDGSHMIPITHPDFLAQRIHDFLAAAR